MRLQKQVWGIAGSIPGGGAALQQGVTISTLAGRYSGYCAWRGVLRDTEAPEAAAAAREAYSELGQALYFELSDARTHAVLYELPGQRLNWLWCAKHARVGLVGVFDAPTPAVLHALPGSSA